MPHKSVMEWCQRWRSSLGLTLISSARELRVKMTRYLLSMPRFVGPVWKIDADSPLSPAAASKGVNMLDLTPSSHLHLSSPSPSLWFWREATVHCSKTHTEAGNLELEYDYVRGCYSFFLNVSLCLCVFLPFLKSKLSVLIYRYCAVAVQTCQYLHIKSVRLLVNKETMPTSFSGSAQGFQCPTSRRS